MFPDGHVCGARRALCAVLAHRNFEHASFCGMGTVVTLLPCRTAVLLHLCTAVLLYRQVSSITIQPEVMHLLRQLLVTWLPRSEPIRQLLLTLPHVTPQVGTHSLLQLRGRGGGLQQPCQAWCCQHRAASTTAKYVITRLACGAVVGLG